MKASEIEKHEIIPTSIPSLNEILGGGFPSKIIIEIAGMEGTGKSTLALQFLAQAQRLGRPTYYADAERSIDFVEFASAVGIDCDILEYDKQDYGEALLERMARWIDGGEFGDEKFKPHKNAVVVLDSIGGISGRDEQEKPTEAETRALQSRIIGKFCRKIEPVIDRQNAVLIFINHLYHDQSIMSRYPIYKSKGGQVFQYLKGLSVWVSKSDKPPKRSSDGSREIEYRKVEIKQKAKYMGAFVGAKVDLEFIPKLGFVGEYVKLPEKKKKKTGQD